MDSALSVPTSLFVSPLELVNQIEWLRHLTFGESVRIAEGLAKVGEEFGIDTKVSHHPQLVSANFSGCVIRIGREPTERYLVISNGMNASYGSFNRSLTAVRNLVEYEQNGRAEQH